MSHPALARGLPFLSHMFPSGVSLSREHPRDARNPPRAGPASKQGVPWGCSLAATLRICTMGLGGRLLRGGCAFGETFVRAGPSPPLIMPRRWPGLCAKSRVRVVELGGQLGAGRCGPTHVHLCLDHTHTASPHPCWGPLGARCSGRAGRLHPAAGRDRTRPSRPARPPAGRWEDMSGRVCLGSALLFFKLRTQNSNPEWKSRHRRGGGWSPPRTRLPPPLRAGCTDPVGS